jgi:FMN phosphatase YigB (HAD superfamily)
LLADHSKSFIDKKRFVEELIIGTQAAIANTDPTLTNQDVFWSVFCQRTGIEREAFEFSLKQFYQDEFPKLRRLTNERPVARKIVRTSFEKNLKVVIATNPLFPASAIEQRLDWAGIPVEEFPYDLVTTYENMHATKPQQAYYEEILEVIDVESAAALMVGDDWKNDMEPASQLGLRTYWVQEGWQDPPELVPAIDGVGSIESLYLLFLEGWLESPVSADTIDHGN